MSSELLVISEKLPVSAAVLPRNLVLECAIPTPGFVQLPISQVRFVAVSATIPNAGDLGSWLGVPKNGLLTFGDEIRPVKLQTVVRGYKPTKTDFLFERRLDGFLPNIISEYSSGQPAMVFCRSAPPIAASGLEWSGLHWARNTGTMTVRRSKVQSEHSVVQLKEGTVDTAANLVEYLSNQGGSYLRDASHAAELVTAARAVKHKQLPHVLRAGIGFHYAAMEQEDRAIVEQLFLNRLLAVRLQNSKNPSHHWKTYPDYQKQFLHGNSKSILWRSCHMHWDLHMDESPHFSWPLWFPLISTILA